MTDTETLRQQITELLPEGADLDAVLDAWRNTTPDERERILLADRGQLARAFGEEGFKHFYWCITKREYPDAHLPLLQGLIEAYENKSGIMIEAWRGFGKSTDLMLWSAYLIGIRPYGSTSLVRINDPKAQEAGDEIASIIKHSMGWKACFPNIVPDAPRGWSGKFGYYVQDTNVTGPLDSSEYAIGYSNWLEKCFADHASEPTLICAGITSGVIIGLHPTNGMYFDDLHDELNTRSLREMQEVVDTLEGNIIPTWFSPHGKPTIVVVYTPWDPDRDAYCAIYKTGLFKKITIPIYKSDPEGELFEPLDVKVRLTWPEFYPMSRLLEIFNASTLRRFYQMYLLDAKAAKINAVYKYQDFDHTKIDLDWPIGSGVDPVYSIAPRDAVMGHRGTSHFALANVARTPYGQAVIIGGVLDRCSASEGMAHVISNEGRHKNYLSTYCEMDGGGAVFVQMVVQTPGVRIIPFSLSEISRRAKGDRQYEFLEPLFKNGLVMVSDEHTPFLDCLRSYLEKYPNIIDRHAPEWDAADALVAALYGLPDVRNRAVISPTIGSRRNVQPNPFAGLASFHYLSNRR